MFLEILLLLVSVVLIMCKNKNAKLIGKILLGIILVPIIGFILLFATCLVIVGIGNISG